jgi:hypothetical protein
MAYREFEDSEGNAWRVWDVHPSHAERRVGDDRRSDDRLESLKDRRRMSEPRVLMPPELMAGWLCFECGDQRKRLVPVPEGWQSAPAAQLRHWLHEAALTPPRRLRP